MVEETRIAADLWAVSRGTLELATFLEQHGYQGPDAGQLHVRVWREDPGAASSPRRGLTPNYLTPHPPPSWRTTKLPRATARKPHCSWRHRSQRRVGTRTLLAYLAARFVPHRERKGAAIRWRSTARA